MPLSKRYIWERLTVAAEKPFPTAERKLTVADLLAIRSIPAFITESYRHFLGRDPDPEGLSSHQKFLEGGGNRLEFLRVLRDSPEGEEKSSTALDGWRRLSFRKLLEIEDPRKFVISAYRNYLWRNPNEDEFPLYENALAFGEPKALILQSIRSSDEARDVGSQVHEEHTLNELLAMPADEFCTAAYRTLLWRDPDAEELQSLHSDLARGVPRARILWQIESSEEAHVITSTIVPAEWRPRTFEDLLAIPAREEFLDTAFRTLLWRDPDVAGRRFFLERLGEGTARQWVLWQIESSAEARKIDSSILPEEWRPKTFGQLMEIDHDEDFLKAAYRTCLWRDPDPAGLRQFREALSRKIPRAAILGRLEASSEARRLGSSVAPAEWLPRSFDELLAISDERNFFAAAYRTYLWRDPDEAGVRSFADLLGKGCPKAHVLYLIGNSEEAQKLDSGFPADWLPKTAEELAALPDDVFLQSLYRTVLWRDPDSAAEYGYGSQLLCGRPRRRLILEVARSREATQLPVRTITLGRRFWLSALPSAGLWRLRTMLFGRALRHSMESADFSKHQLAELRRISSQQEATIGQWKESLSVRLVRREESLQQIVPTDGSPPTVPIGDILKPVFQELNSQTATLGTMLDVSQKSASRIREIEKRGLVVSALLDALQSHLPSWYEFEKQAAAWGAALTDLQQNFIRQLAERDAALTDLRQSIAYLEANNNVTLRELRETLALHPVEVRHQAADLSEKLDARSAQIGRGISDLGQGLAAVTEAILVNRHILQEGLRTGTKPSRSAVLVPGDLVLTDLDGFLYALPAEDIRLVAYLTFRGQLEIGMHRLLERWVQPGMHIIDAGANIGLHSLLFARRAGPEGQVYCFEPSPRIFPILNLNALMNNLTSRMKTWQLALSDGPGTASFFLHETCGHSSLYEDEPGRTRVEVKTNSLDNIIEAGQKIDLVKIDVEGAEPLVLRGLSRVIEENPRIVIVLEFTPYLLERANYAPSRFFSEILSLGFTIRKIDDLTGDLLPITEQSLLNTFSSNLFLTRTPEGGG